MYPQYLRHGRAIVFGWRSGVRKRSGKLLRGAAWSLAVLGAALVGVYEYQPQRYDLFPRGLPAVNPWTDPDSRRLFSPAAKVAIITAHPDDAEFYLGGALTRLGKAGARLSLIVCTDGDKGYYPFEDAARNRRVRRQEQRTAAGLWNAAEVDFLGYPDGRLFAKPDVVSALADRLRRIKPDYVIAFDPEYPPRLSHRDHRNSGEAAERAVKEAGVGTWLLRFSTRAPNYALDVTAEWPRKEELLRIHKSQFSGDRLSFIYRLVAGSAAQYGRLTHTRYAEGFRCTRLR
jgi:LmbE family N-acetylglucosaminyl deacetylase